MSRFVCVLLFPTLGAASGAEAETPANAGRPEQAVADQAQRDDVRPPADREDRPALTAEKDADAATVSQRKAQPSNAVETPGPTAGGVKTGETEPRRLKFSFRFQPWTDVLDWFAKEADLSLALDVTPTGTFNYVDDTTYTPAEALDLLNGVLLTKGYTLVRRNKMLFIIDLEDELDAKLVRDLLVEVSEDDLDERGEFEVTKCRFRLKHVAPEAAEKQISKLLSPLGSIVVMPRAGQLVVTETGGILRAVRDILRSLDRAVAEESLQAFPLERASADNVLMVARPLLGIPEDAGAAEDGSIRISADPLGNTVLATGDPDKIALVRQIVEQVDKAGLSGTGRGGALAAPQFMTHPITSADPDAVLRVLQTILVGETGVRIEIDPSTGDVIALARPAQHRTIEATIAEMERRPEQFAVIPLRTIDPTAAALLIGKMLGTNGEGENPKGPTVDGTFEPRQLVVRGTRSQIDQVRALLQSLGEVPNETLPAAAQRGNVRFLQVDPQAAQAALEHVERVWSTMRGNPIQIVTPSSPIDTRRPRGGPAARPRRTLPDPSGDPARRLRGGLPRSGAHLHGPSGDDGEKRGDVAPDRDATGNEPRTPPSNTTDTAAPVWARIVAVAGAVVPDRVDQPAPLQPRPSQTDASAASEHAAPAVNPRPAHLAGDDPPTGDAAEIFVRVEPGGLTIASADAEALDAFEALLDVFARQAGGGVGRFHLFYLKHVKAELARDLLSSIMAGVGSPGGATAVSSGDAAKSARDGLRGGLLGLAATGRGGPVLAGGGVRMTADDRLNALFVQGSPAEVNLVEQLLEVIDQESGPEEVLTFPKPKFIPVYYTSADDVAGVLRQLYAGRIVSERSDSRGTSSRESFLQAMRGFGDRRRRDESPNQRGSDQRSGDEGPKMSLGVDATSNSLIVSAPGPLLKEVEAVVRELDQRAGTESTQDVAVVRIKRVNPQLVQQSLSTVLGGAVRTGDTTRSSRGGPGRSDSRARPSDSGASSGGPRDDFRQRMEMFDAIRRRMQGGGSSRGGDGGGSRGRRSR